MNDPLAPGAVEIWYVRHGETDWNRAGLIQGWIDLPLNDVGASQARRLAPRLAGVAFDAVFASDLGRARATAQSALPGVDVRLDPRLRELDYGVFEGKAWDALEGEEAALAARWRADPVGQRIPDGESYGDMQVRLDAFRADLPPGRYAVFSHGGAIRVALYGVLGRPAPGTWRLEIDNTSITRVRYEERGPTLVTLNDHAHL